TILRAECASIDMYASIDSIHDKLEVQLKKHNDKQKDHRPHTHEGSKKPKKTPSKPLQKERHYHTKPLSPEDAALELEAENLPFLVFRNAHTEAINVVYISEDKSIRLIET
ncbi:MAG: HPF/RaiA family ribosome-associated protein, partial [Candidatus Margulisbacteria bacterium]|nr:HPF/RaiA family ribosome-associated protein [Candidatus Margulisiibacteriota bacterium]